MSKNDNEKNENYALGGALIGFACGVGVMTIVSLLDKNQTLRKELSCANDLAQHNFDYWKVLTDFVVNNGLAKEALDNYNEVFAKK